MRPDSLLTRREIVLAALGLALLGLTGSTSAVSAQILPPDPPTPALVQPSTPPPVRTAAPRSAAPRPAGAGARLPRVPIVDATARPAARVDDRGIPVRLQSGDLHLDLPVRPVGVDRDGEMELPDTVSQVGWYEFSAAPATGRGSTVLAAHVDTRSEGLGPFIALRDARRGQQVSVVDRAGNRHRYRVSDVVSLAKPRIDWDQVFDRRGPARLILITCGGAYDRGSGYRDNVLVTTIPVS